MTAVVFVVVPVALLVAGVRLVSVLAERWPDRDGSTR